VQKVAYDSCGPAAGLREPSSMSIDEAITKLRALRKRWKNNGSTIEFNKAEGELYRAFKHLDPDVWAGIQRKARE